MKHPYMFNVVGILLAACTCNSTHAESLPLVAVEFRLEQLDWRRQFNDAELTQLEGHVTKLITHRLADRIGFVRFTNRPGPSYVLTFHLRDIKGASNSRRRETGFYITLTSGRSQSKELYWQFRPENSFSEPVVDWKAFALEIDLRFQDDTNYPDLIGDTLSRVPMAAGTVFYRGEQFGKREQFGWILPHSRAEICADYHTTVRIESMLSIGAIRRFQEHTGELQGEFKSGEPRWKDYVGRVFSVPIPETQVGLEDLRNLDTGRVETQAVYVVKYAYREPCSVAQSPAAVRF
jgi:hypothetical protein